MGVLVMVLGPSGSGKSTSLRHVGYEGTMVFGSTGKRLPFKGSALSVHAHAGYRDIYDALVANKARRYVVDDSTYLMQFDNFAHARERGYDKFVTMALSFETLLDAATRTNEDTTVYLLHHPSFADDGSCKPQTIGKMLDNQLCIEGLCDCILECAVEEGQHVFYTNERGIAKTPYGMFAERTIPNDLALVDKTIRDFWGMGPVGGDETHEG